MDINSRILYLRSEVLNLTMEAFGQKIEMTRGAISSMEKGRRIVSERTIKIICGEFERGAGTIKITSVNIGEIRNTDVEVSFITAMNNFSCKDMNVEDFLKNKALDFDARNVARTYLLIDEEQYLRRVIIILAYTNPWRSF